MTTKINKFINGIFCRFPLWAHLTTIIVLAFGDGFIRTIINNAEASVSNGITSELITSLTKLYVGLLCISLVEKYVSKLSRLMLNNRVFTKITHRINMSKISNINSVSTGKIFSAMQSLASLKTDMVLNCIYVIPTVLPAANLVLKEYAGDKTGCFITLGSLIMSTIMALSANKLFGWTDMAKAKKSKLHGITVDNILNVKTLKSIGKTKYAEMRLDEAQKDALPVMTNGAGMIWWRLIEAISWAPILINIYLNRDNVELCVLVLMANYTIENLRSYLTNIADLLQEINSENKIIESLKGDDIAKRPLIKKELHLKDIIFDHGVDTPKFKINNLVFAKSSRTLVTGVSGSGKSSLANLLTGSIEPKVGEVPTFDFCYIWQETECLDDTLWNNIVFDNEYGVEAGEVIELFKELNMLDWFYSLSNGFKTHIGEKGCKLSSGQKQRVNIIRLIIEMRYAPQKVFIIDEITSNLDDETKDLAISLIDRECRSTLICISHNDGFDRICENHIIVKNHRFYPERSTRYVKYDEDHDIKIYSIVHHDEMDMEEDV